MKLIEASQAKETAQTLLADPILQWAVNAVLKNTPGMDIVRCEDCKHYNDYFIQCDCPNGLPRINADSFCSYGERKME